MAGCALGPLFQPDTYIVERGDTLYSIAWRYHVDWRNLADWNGIRPPYRIYPGQTLHLDGRTRSAGTQPKRPRTTAETRPRESAPPRWTPSADDPAWRWPVEGEVLRGYSSRHARRGIDIGGKSGQAVHAAAAGRVVYSGSGLKGYGNLVIIKHDDRYLSAYGFNRRLRVVQGDNVDSGQHIADMGLGPENRPMLYFEIRRDGEPVNPQRLLPGA